MSLGLTLFKRMFLHTIPQENILKYRGYVLREMVSKNERRSEPHTYRLKPHNLLSHFRTLISYCSVNILKRSIIQNRALIIDGFCTRTIQWP